jgi:hypothetical protein
MAAPISAGVVMPRSFFQLPKDQHPQADRDQPVGVSGAALFGRELGLCGRRGWRRLVGEQAHVSMVVTAMAGIIPTLPRWSFTV